MTNKTNSKAPFGVASKRFNGSIGFHPGLDPSGSMMKNKNKLGPGEYNSRKFECPYKKHSGASWKRKVEMEEFSKNLGYRNASVLEERRFRRAFGGPGDYEISESVYKRTSPSSIDNVGFGRQKRFATFKRFNPPPPGTYATNLELYSKRHTQFTPLPSFEWDGFVDRFKSADKPWTKPPNLYSPIDRGSVKSLLNKVVSKRGPYDLFTGPRDETTIKNHLAPPAFKGPLNIFNVSSTPLDVLLTHPRNHTRGRFFREQRFGRATMRHMIDDPTQVLRDAKEPSPCTYNVIGSNEVKKSKYAFNQSVKYPRPPIAWKIFPGVGRYSPKYCTCAQPKAESWIFKSTIGRPEYKAVEYNSF